MCYMCFVQVATTFSMYKSLVRFVGPKLRLTSDIWIVMKYIMSESCLIGYLLLYLINRSLN